MSAQHRKPCNDCPWRRKACPGWVGSEYNPEEWANLAHQDGIADCHKHETAQCAGMAIYRANVFKSPRDPEALILPADHALVFSSPLEFVKHHRSRKGHTSADMGIPKTSPRPMNLLNLSASR